MHEPEDTPYEEWVRLIDFKPHCHVQLLYCSR